MRSDLRHAQLRLSEALFTWTTLLTLTGYVRLLHASGDARINCADIAAWLKRGRDVAA